MWCVSTPEDKADYEKDWAAFLAHKGLTHAQYLAEKGVRFVPSKQYKGRDRRISAQRLAAARKALKIDVKKQRAGKTGGELPAPNRAPSDDASLKAPSAGESTEGLPCRYGIIL